ncbi:hypothetical protein DOY81_007325 [Sarcophaga bullata]|nr:hypothetical protein DOY81_007325 [Sarcophaga bullata]
MAIRLKNGSQSSVLFLSIFAQQGPAMLRLPSCCQRNWHTCPAESGHVASTLLLPTKLILAGKTCGQNSNQLKKKEYLSLVTR